MNLHLRNICFNLWVTSTVFYCTPSGVNTCEILVLHTSPISTLREQDSSHPEE